MDEFYSEIFPFIDDDDDDEQAQESYQVIWNTLELENKQDYDLDNTHFSVDPIEIKPIIDTLALIPSMNTIESVILSPASSTSATYTPSSLPANQSWPGQYDFTASVEDQDKNTKGVTWTYSRAKQKLYVGRDTPCPINFSANQLLSEDVKIRAQAFFSSPEYATEVVSRCMSHHHEDMQKGIGDAQHLVRCESIMAVYETNYSTKHNSVLVPFENPAAGQHFSTYIFKFTCFGSCVGGGPNRRPLTLIFSLEENGLVVGRQKMDIKICACPGRDRKAEEKLERQLVESQPPEKRKHVEMFSEVSETIRVSTQMFPTKKTKTSTNPQGYYTIRAKDKDMYDFLIQMKKMYKMHKAYQHLHPEMKKTISKLVQNKNLSGDSDDG